MEDWLIDECKMKALVQILKESNHSLVIYKNDISTYDGRGISDLFRLLHEQPATLEDALLADKIVGKGAAALMALGKVKEMYADIISQSALELLEQEGIRTTYGKLVSNIINRAGTGMCPVEARCLPCKTPAECFEQIRVFIKEMKQKEYIE